MAGRPEKSGKNNDVNRLRSRRVSTAKYCSVPPPPKVDSTFASSPPSSVDRCPPAQPPDRTTSSSTQKPL